MPTCLVPVLFYTGQVAMGRPYDLPYSVELWDDADSHVEELIALTGDYRVARAAFDEAVKCRPGRVTRNRTATYENGWWSTMSTKRTAR